MADNRANAIKGIDVFHRAGPNGRSNSLWQLFTKLHFPDLEEVLQNYRSKRKYEPQREILRYAGREAAASFRIALPKKGFDGIKAIVDEVIFEEPFTFWDWKARAAEDSEYKDLARDHRDPWKRRLLWEGGRSFQANGSHIGHQFPSPYEQWTAFKHHAENSPTKAKAVKRLALPAWTTRHDLMWIVRHLTNLEALDLSLFPDGVISSTLLHKLKWLGVGDPRFLGTSQRQRLAKTVQRCSKLETLSVRGKYDCDTDCVPRISSHKAICQFIIHVVDSLPASVTDIELRLAIGWMPLLLEYISKIRPAVKRVGVDIGAWVQMYPFRDKSRANLCEGRVTSKAVEAAKTAIRQIQDRHDTNGLDIQEYAVKLDHIAAARNLENQSYFHDKSGRVITSIRKEEQRERHDRNCDLAQIQAHVNKSTTATTLSKMLKKMYHAFEINSNIEAFALEPEVQAQSNHPLNPLALVQAESNLLYWHGNEFGGPLTAEEFSWLGSKLEWKPIIDWDPMMLLQANKIEQDIEPSLLDLEFPPTTASDTNSPSGGTRRLKQPSAWFEEQRSMLITYFREMNKAHLPVHILIGRRDPAFSNYYWGWPYNKTSWKQKVKDDNFQCNLEPYAEYVNTLSILYDIRNPLDRDRLEAIALKGIGVMSLPFCPERACPWKGKDCPFKKRVDDIERGSTDRPPPSTAVRPAPVFRGDPPAAKLDEVCDPGTDIEISDVYYVACNAAHAREMYGWHRFWNHNALLFRRLTMLRLRIPKDFENISSYRLGKLVQHDIGWEQLSYTDEIRREQTSFDTAETVGGIPSSTFHHHRMVPEWQAGRYKRRTWIWREYDPGREGEVDPGPRKRRSWGYRAPAFAIKVDTASLESKQANDAAAHADECANEEDTEYAIAPDRTMFTELNRAYDDGDGDGDGNGGNGDNDNPLQASQAAQNPQSAVTFPNTAHAQGLRNVAGDAFRATIRDHRAQIVEQNRNVTGYRLLVRNRIANALTRRSHQVPPYSDIFQNAPGGSVNNLAIAGDPPVPPPQAPIPNRGVTIFDDIENAVRHRQNQNTRLPVQPTTPTPAPRPRSGNAPIANNDNWITAQVQGRNPIQANLDAARGFNPAPLDPTLVEHMISESNSEIVYHSPTDRDSTHSDNTNQNADRERSPGSLPAHVRWILNHPLQDKDVDPLRGLTRDPPIGVPAAPVPVPPVPAAPVPVPPVPAAPVPDTPDTIGRLFGVYEDLPSAPVVCNNRGAPANPAPASAARDDPDAPSDNSLFSVPRVHRKRPRSGSAKSEKSVQLDDPGAASDNSLFSVPRVPRKRPRSGSAGSERSAQLADPGAAAIDDSLYTYPKRAARPTIDDPDPSRGRSKPASPARSRSRARQHSQPPPARQPSQPPPARPSPPPDRPSPPPDQPPPDQPEPGPGPGPSSPRPDDHAGNGPDGDPDNPPDHDASAPAPLPARKRARRRRNAGRTVPPPSSAQADPAVDGSVYMQRTVPQLRRIATRLGVALGGVTLKWDIVQALVRDDAANGRQPAR